jgi:T5orf172 domain-containing protein
LEVHQKWGFGMAPPKPAAEERRRASAMLVRALLAGSCVQDQATLDALSEVKGLFARVARQDQWDWFTVCAQLGYPSGRIARAITTHLRMMRSALKTGETVAFEVAQEALSRLPADRCLQVYLRRLAIQDEPGAGWVYLLSTRENREQCKIGFTSRRVEARLKEINRATGIAIPFGVRGCWRVRNPEAAERRVHAALAEYRIRADREFFKVPYNVASTTIMTCLRDAGLELRTLDNLGALSSS